MNFLKEYVHNNIVVKDLFESSIVILVVFEKLCDFSL